MQETTITTKKGNTYNFYRTTNDVNGNPRYIVHFLDLGLKLSSKGTILKDTRTKQCGLTVFRGKAFGGGYVFQSYNLQQDAEHFEEIGLCRLD